MKGPWIVGVALIWLGLAGLHHWGVPNSGALTPATAQSLSRASAPATPAPSTPAPLAKEPEFGRFRVVYDKPKNKDYKIIASALKKSGVYDALAEKLTATYKLPADIVIRFTELDEENAYFDPETNEITVGYEMIDWYRGMFEMDEDDPEAVRQDIVDIAFFTVLHEVGHALVALLELPITGREEDAVDDFATLALLEMNDDQAEAALLSAIEQFAADADEYESISELPFADEHSLDKQRFYQMLSLVYGSDPDYYSDLLGGDYLPEDRAESSEEEYEQKSAAWEKLLAPHLKETSESNR